MLAESRILVQSIPCVICALLKADTRVLCPSKGTALLEYSVVLLSWSEGGYWCSLLFDVIVGCCLTRVACLWCSMSRMY